MKDSLVARGIPAKKIILDYSGWRTIKSIENIKNKYNINKVTIISQKSHNKRALFIANHFGINAIGYNA